MDYELRQAVRNKDFSRMATLLSRTSPVPPKERHHLKGEQKIFVIQDPNFQWIQGKFYTGQIWIRTTPFPTYESESSQISVLLDPEYLWEDRQRIKKKMKDKDKIIYLNDFDIVYSLEGILI